MVYHFKVHKEAGGYWAECVELEGGQTQGDTLEELKSNAVEALNLFLAEPEETGVVFPLPQRKKKDSKLLQVPVEPGIALSLMLKTLRAKRKLTQRKTADLLGFANIYSYQKLESPKTSNPELKTLKKLKSVFPELQLDELF